MVGKKAVGAVLGGLAALVLGVGVAAAADDRRDQSTPTGGVEYTMPPEHVEATMPPELVEATMPPEVAPVTMPPEGADTKEQ